MMIMGFKTSHSLIPEMFIEITGVWVALINISSNLFLVCVKTKH